MEAGWPIDVVQRWLVGFIPLTIPALKVARTPGQCRRNERLTPHCCGAGVCRGLRTPRPEPQTRDTPGQGVAGSAVGLRWPLSDGLVRHSSGSVTAPVPVSTSGRRVTRGGHTVTHDRSLTGDVGTGGRRHRETWELGDGDTGDG